MKNFILVLVMTGLSHFALAGGGVRGGEVVDVNGTREIRDVIEQATCDWKTGQEILATYPEVTKIITSIKKLDWYFAMDIEKELRSLNFCFTGPLRPIEINMDASIHVPSNYPSLFAGLRYRDQVHVDTKILKSLSPSTQGLFFIHETFHSYLPQEMDPAERRIDLMSMVNFINKVNHGLVTSREALHYAMRQNNFQFPRTVAELDGYRKQLEFILGDDFQQREIFLSTLTPEVLVKNHYYKMEPYLAPWDQESVRQTPNTILTSAIQMIIKTGSPSQIDYVLNTQTFKRISPQFIALGEYPNLSSGQQEALNQKLNLSSAIQNALGEFNKTSVTVNNDRIVASAQLQELAGLKGSVKSVPVMQLSSLDSEAETSTEIKVLNGAILVLVQSNALAAFKTNISENPQFYSALRLDQTLAQVTSIQGADERDRRYSQGAIKNLSASLVERFKQTLEGELSDEDFQTVSGLIHWEQFQTGSK